jgi:hypothetical protein
VTGDDGRAPTRAEGIEGGEGQGEHNLRNFCNGQLLACCPKPSCWGVSDINTMVLLEWNITLHNSLGAFCGVRYHISIIFL